MTEKEEIITLLEEKVELLLKFEQITDGIYYLPIEEIHHSMNKRQALVNKMMKIDERIELLCSGLEPVVYEAVRNRCSRGELTEEIGRIYDKALETRTVARRADRNSDAIRERIELEQQKTRAEIQKLNTSSSTVAGRYGQAVNTANSNRTVQKNQGTKI